MEVAEKKQDEEEIEECEGEPTTITTLRFPQGDGGCERPWNHFDR